MRKFAPCKCDIFAADCCTIYPPDQIGETVFTQFNIYPAVKSEEGGEDA